MAGSESFDKTTALLQVDFSENYTCVYQDEIQSAHWQQNQVSLFTGALLYSGKLHSRVIASDNITHTKETLLAYIDRLLEDIPASIWSDGPASQFKNRFIAASLAILEKKHQIQIQWNYVATSHGQGPVDGIWGAKAAKGMTGVYVDEMSALNIETRNESLQLSQVLMDAPLIKGIARLHHIRVVNNDVTSFIRTADANMKDINSAVPDKQKCKVGDWCAVTYMGTIYPGEVKEIDCGSCFCNDSCFGILEVATTT